MSGKREEESIKKKGTQPSVEETLRHLEAQSGYLKDIRRHFMPELEERRERLLIKRLTGVVTKLLVGFAFICGLWELIGWYWDRAEIAGMARRYADVAHDIYYVEGNPDVALDFLNRAIELEESSTEYRFQRAYVEGMSVVRRLLNLDHPLTKADLDASHRALAQAIFLKGLQPDRAEPYILEGQVYVVLKEFDRAAEKIQHAISLEPENEFAHVRHATLLMELDRVDEAESALERALRINPASKWAWLWKGVLLSEKRRDYVAARAAFQRAVAIDSRFDLAWYNLGWTWVNRNEKNYSKAQEMMEKVLSLNPDYKEAYYAIGFFYGSRNNYEVARVYMDKALGVDSSFLTARKWRGIVNIELGNFAEAVEDFNAAIILDPMNADLYVRRAKAYRAMGKLDSTVRDLRFAAGLDPDNKRIWYTMAQVSLQGGDIVKAEALFRKAIDCDEFYAEAYAGIAQVMLQSGLTPKAIENIDKAIEVAKYRPERFLLEKGRILEGEGRGDEALELYGKAGEADADFYDAWWALARLSAEMNRTSQARAAISACLELRPDSKEAKQLLSEL